MMRCFATAILAAVVIGAGWSMGLLAGHQHTVRAADTDTEAQRAVERTRKTVRMLDDIYKSAVVLITDKYVNTETDFPAGSAAIALFKAVEDKGWHKVRLIDLTGDPYEPENVARDAFEKAASKRMLAGEAYWDQVADVDGRRVLRAATPVPVVMKKCAMCHPHYNDVPEGQAIGALIYSVPIE